MRSHAVASLLLFALAPGCTPDPSVPVADTGGSTGPGEGSTSTGPGGSTESDAEPSTGPTGTASGDTGLDDTGTSETGRDDTGTSETGTEPVCGNGMIEDGEACDDAGESATCNDDCTTAACGDGITNATAGEACDDMAESASCDGDCSPASCGDGIVNVTALEECDDGGESAACDVDCTISSCGDGVFNASAGELCDEGGPTLACDDDCSLASCGDGLVNPAAGEACDDGVESESCNLDCSLAACSDGITNLSAGEDCDDMGESLSCDTDCSTVACGDGTTNATAGESCDDAGESTLCDADCTLATCGDGYLNAAAGEPCDGPALGGGATCQSLGYSGGTLACAPGCTLDASGCADLPGIPVLSLSFAPIKQFDFSWAAVADADYYHLEESAAPGEPFLPLGGDVLGTSISHTMPLHLRWQASYRLRACNVAGCTDSAPVSVMSSLAEAVGYFKASNTGQNDDFGWDVALSADGTTLAVSAHQEGSSATGINGNQGSDGAPNSGAVYVFVRDGMGGWSQQAYIKASNTDAADQFGESLALSVDGNTLAVGAVAEDSNATGVGGNQADDSLSTSGATYVFVRDGAGVWSQQAYIKASNPDEIDYFGELVALSGDGDTLAVGAWNEDSSASGIDGNQADDSLESAGAVYVFTRDGVGTWSQQAYVKASNPGYNDRFGHAAALSGDGDTLAVGALYEDSSATGIDGDQNDAGNFDGGAVYVFVRDGAGTWSQQAYVKASNTDVGDFFGYAVALSGAGNTLAVGAPNEDSGATDIDGDQADDGATNAGAVYVFVRDGLGTWSQQAYVKASNTDSGDFFGQRVELSSDGSVLAASTDHEDANAVGIGGDGANNAASSSGAAYVFTRDGLGAWSHAAYVKASNTASIDIFGWSVALSGDGQTLAVGARYEDSNATGIGGDQANDLSSSSGAVYLY